MLPPYQNEPLSDFSNPDNVKAFEEALTYVRSQLGKRYPMIIGGEEVWTDETYASINPARPDEIVGIFPEGTAEHADRAVEAATNAFQEWQYVPVYERARYLLKAAAEMRRRKHEFSAWMVFEVGKSWIEADADTAEAIDFLEYYARQMMRLDNAHHQLTERSGEDLDLQYVGLGPVAVIPPWNFPVAIATGMTSASLVAGNATMLKPARESSICGYKIAELFLEQHIPPGVLNFLTGEGAIIGEALVDHPGTRMIAFTGSRGVGIRINERAAKVHPGQLWLKRVIAEMGGKDAVMVDETADLDAAAKAIVASAFGFQGQKCSAGSRAILVDSIYDEVVERVVALTKALTIGETDTGNDIYMGPVISEVQFGKIMDYIRIGHENHTLLHGGSTIETPSNGYFIEPTIFGDVPSGATIAQEEIFGPVLAIIRTHDFDEGIKIFNGTDYGLTGSLWSRNRARLERARRELHVGNLYFNRKSTGAIVGAHPFGGFNMSGTDSKAGGPDYLLLFTQAKSIAEVL